MLRILIGSIAGGIAMYIVGFIFWVTPLNNLAFATASEVQDATVQTALAQNLPHTGHYIVPNPASPGGTVLYGRGPIATIEYNSGGSSATDTAIMVGGFIQEVVVALLIGMSLYGVSARVTDFNSRARLVIGFSTAVSLLIRLGNPIWFHADWRFAIYAFVADVAMLCAAGLVMARWFVPNGVAAVREV